MTWQPIETAPKDGTLILAAWDKSQAVSIVSYAKEPTGGFFWLTDDDCFVSTPTHWMPLPEPPKP